MKEILVIMLLIILFEVIERWYNRIKNCRLKVVLSTVNNCVDNSDKLNKELEVLTIDFLQLLIISIIVFLAPQIEKNALFSIVLEILLKAILS